MKPPKLSDIKKQIDEWVRLSGSDNPFVNFSVYSKKGIRVGNFILKNMDFTPTSSGPVLEFKFQVTEG